MLISVGGVFCIGFSDVNASEDMNQVWGDVVSIISAAMYGLYATLLKKSVNNEEEFQWFVFFGFVGVNVAVFAFFGFFVLNACEVEKFEWPNAWAFFYLFINGLVGTVVSDYFWARAVVLLDPLVVTIGMGMTIPIGMIADAIFKQKRFDYLYILGSVFIFISFVSLSLYDFVYLRKKKKPQSENDVDEGRTESIFLTSNELEENLIERKGS